MSYVIISICRYCTNATVNLYNLIWKIPSCKTTQLHREGAGHVGIKMVKKKDHRVWSPCCCCAMTEWGRNSRPLGWFSCPIPPAPFPEILLHPVKGTVWVEIESNDGRLGRIGLQQFGICVSADERMRDERRQRRESKEKVWLTA